MNAAADTPASHHGAVNDATAPVAKAARLLAVIELLVDLFGEHTRLREWVKYRLPNGLEHLPHLPDGDKTDLWGFAERLVTLLDYQGEIDRNFFGLLKVNFPRRTEPIERVFAFWSGEVQRLELEPPPGVSVAIQEKRANRLVETLVAVAIVVAVAVMIRLYVYVPPVEEGTTQRSSPEPAVEVETKSVPADVPADAADARIPATSANSAADEVEALVVPDPAKPVEKKDIRQSGSTKNPRKKGGGEALPFPAP